MLAREMVWANVIIHEVLLCFHPKEENKKSRQHYCCHSQQNLDLDYEKSHIKLEQELKHQRVRT